MKIKIPLIIITVSLILVGCFPKLISNTSKSSNVISNNHNPFIYKMHTEFMFNRTASGNNRLFIKLNLQEFMFARLKESRKLQGKVHIKYFLYKHDDLENIIDSSNFTFQLKKEKGQNSAITYLPVKNIGLAKFYMKIITIDMLRRRVSQDFLYINFEDKNSSNNFFIQQATGSVPYFRRYCRNNQFFNINYYDSVDSIYVKSFKNVDIPVPPKPYSPTMYVEPNLQCDSIYSISGKSHFQFETKEQALYCLQVDTTNNRGCYMLNTGENYPYVKSSENMVYPLQYLCKAEEFRNLLGNPNKKLAIDRFWLKAGGNTNRARELIRIFYNRVLYANIYFTSYTDGWKTDRGMIYLMFGTPKMVRRQADKEIWRYSDRFNQKVLQFIFSRYPSAYSDNVFVLNRSIDFEKFWRESVKSWREGRVYNVFRK